MGLGKQGGRDLIAALKAGTTTRQALRAQIGDAVDVLTMKALALDLQLAAAAQGFAESKSAQFATYVAALPEVGDTTGP